MFGTRIFEVCMTNFRAASFLPKHDKSVSSSASLCIPVSENVAEGVSR